MQLTVPPHYNSVVAGRIQEKATCLLYKLYNERMSKPNNNHEKEDLYFFGLTLYTVLYTYGKSALKPSGSSVV